MSNRSWKYLVAVKKYKYKEINEKIGSLTANLDSEEINTDEFINGIALNISQPTNFSLLLTDNILS